MRGLVVMVAMATTACGAAVAPPVTIGNRAGAGPAVSPPPARRSRGLVIAGVALVMVVVGLVVDRRTGEPVIGASVVVEHGGTWTVEITDEDGRFAFASLPPGRRRLVTYFGEAQFVIDRVPVTPGWQATIAQRIDTTIAASEVIEIAPWPRTYGP